MSNANIHGFGDSNSRSNNSDRYYDPNDQTPLFYKISYKGDPRSQSIPSFLKEVICPFFHFRSFSFVIIMINIAVYIASLIPHGLESSSIKAKFLPPSSETLDLFGYLYGPRLRESPLQSYRWVANSLLHAYFDHIFANCFGILIFGTKLEYLIGTLRYAIIYILSGILGSLFSVLIENKVRSVGASISCYGLIGSLMAFYLINWNSLPKIYGMNNRCYIILFPLLMIIFMLPIFMDGSDSNVNIYGHLGGLIFGFFLSLFILNRQDEGDTCLGPYKLLFYTGIVVCGGFAIIGFLCFYLLDHYK